MPASKVEALKKEADEVGEKQASINWRIFKLSQADLSSIRDPGWEEYRGAWKRSSQRKRLSSRHHVPWRGDDMKHLRGRRRCRILTSWPEGIGRIAFAGPVLRASGRDAGPPRPRLPGGG